MLFTNVSCQNDAWWRFLEISWNITPYHFGNIELRKLNKANKRLFVFEIVAWPQLLYGWKAEPEVALQTTFGCWNLRENGFQFLWDLLNPKGWLRIYGRPSFGGVSTTKRFLISFDNIEFPGKQLSIDSQGVRLLKQLPAISEGLFLRLNHPYDRINFSRSSWKKKTFCYERSLKISEVFPKNCVLYGVSKINNSTSINFASYKHNWLRKFNFYFQPSSYPAEPEAYDRWPCRGKLTCKWNYLGLFL